MEATATGNRFHMRALRARASGGDIFGSVHDGVRPYAARIVTRKGGDVRSGMAPGAARRVEPDTAARRCACTGAGSLLYFNDGGNLPSSDVRRLVDSEVVDEASRMIRFGAAAMVQTVHEESEFTFYGPGFVAVVTRTDPAADYPGKPAR